MNKKILGAATVGILAIGLLSYISLTPKAKSSNSSDTYEYYYNKNSNTYKEENNLDQKDETTSTMKPDGDVKYTAELDTTPTSLTVLVNKELPLPSNYVPSDLVEPNINYDSRSTGQKRLLREAAARAMEKLFSAASKEGLTLSGVSGYRSYSRQYEIYNKNIRRYGINYTSKYSAAPGYSEHQTGLSMDISSPSFGNNLDEDFIDTKEGKWVEENCYKYGFIIRFPKGKEENTGYAYEPWHIRYVGVELATYLSKNKLCLEEYYNFKYSKDINKTVNNDVDLTMSTPRPKPTVRPTASPSPSPSPTASPKPTNTPKPTASPTPVPTAPPVQEPVVVPPEPVVTPEPAPPVQDPGVVPGTEGAMDPAAITQ